MDVHQILGPGKYEIIYEDDPRALSVLRHSASHVLAAAVKRLWPETKLGIGPATEEGFYYDFEFGFQFEEILLEKIEKEMQKIVNENQPFEREIWTKEQAEEFFKNKGETYKLELLAEIPDEYVSIYRNGDFTDLCKGPHVESTGILKNFKLLSVAGAYWKGDEHNPMLTRIYGTAFFSAEDLEDFLHKREEAKRRDHRRLGKELELFSINPIAGPGLVLWHPKGATVRMILEDFLRQEHIKRGYLPVYSPHIMRRQLWEISGHWENYRDYMFFIENVEGDSYAVKPMNCPAHILVYKSKTRSYRDLPIKYFELGTVYRFEKSGVLHGLLRVRGFTQDDAHIFCTPDQLEDQILNVIEFVEYIMKIFGFDYQVYVGTMPEQHLGSEEVWQRATSALVNALRRKNMNFEIEEGEGAFYGPKIDVVLKDAIGREWQGATIQVDFNLPERFEMEYIGPDGRPHRPVMIHRAILGSLERFFGTLIEHYAGAFPTWLAPVQVKILTISQKFNEYAQKVLKNLQENGLRVEGDFSDERMNAKIRRAQIEKVPYIVIIGAKEQENKKITVRRRDGKNISLIELSEFLKKINSEINEKSLQLKVDV